MHKLNSKKVGLTVGTLLCGWHAVWSLLVLLGLAQPILNFILWAHMIHVDYVVGPFDATACISLLVLTFAVGYVAGYSGTIVWNKYHK